MSVEDMIMTLDNLVDSMEESKRPAWDIYRFRGDGVRSSTWSVELSWDTPFGESVHEAKDTSLEVALRELIRELEGLGMIND